MTATRTDPRAEAHRTQAKNAAEKRRSVSVSSDSADKDEPRHKSRTEDNTISVHATDNDVAELLAKLPVHATVTDNTADASEDELLEELVEALQDEDKKGPKVQQQLADIAIK